MPAILGFAAGLPKQASRSRSNCYGSCVLVDLETSSGMASGARDLLKRSTRAAGMATSAFRPLPDFMIIGAKRGGTTSFYFDLLEHPSVMRLYPPPIPRIKKDATKGTHYFDSNFHRGDRWYRSYFPTTVSRALWTHKTGGPALTGEASPFYLFHPAAAARAHECVPGAKIIALLRDPVMRTYSHWKERRRSDAEEMDFLAALDVEPNRLAGERTKLIGDPGYTSYAWEQQSYFTQSLYAQSLRPWVEAYGRDQVFVAASEDYYADPNSVLGDVHDFLGIPRKATATGMIRNAARGAAMDPKLVEELSRRFREPNEELSDLLGRRLSWS